MPNKNVTIYMDETLKISNISEQRIQFEITHDNLTIASDTALKTASQKLIMQNVDVYKNLAE